MTTRRLAVVLSCAGVLVLLAFVYAALKYRGKPAPAPEIVQSPVVQTQEPSPPVSEPTKTPPLEPPANAEIKPKAARKESAAEQKAPLDPERVAAAWEKVEHIRNNLHLYGDFHPEAEKIIAQLPPPPQEYESEAQAEEIFDLFERLISLNDPRAAEPLVRYRYGGSGNSGAWGDAMDEWGAPCIPFLLEYAHDEVIDFSVAVQLKRIVNRHPDLDPDIVTYILEPLFEKHKDWIRQHQEWGTL